MNPKENILLELLDQHGRKLLGLFTRMTLNPEIAEELMQELFTQLCTVKRLDKIRNVRAYAFRAAVNLVINRQRKMKFTPAAIPADLPAMNVLSPESSAIQCEEIRRILYAVRQFSPLMQKCFILRHIEQLDFDEIGLIVGKTAHQTRGLCFKSIQLLRKLLAVDAGRLSDKDFVHE